MNALFNVPASPYFLSHSVGCLPKEVEKHVSDTLFKPWANNGGDAWPSWLDSLNLFHQTIATLINAPVEGVCAQGNLSSGLTKLLTGLPNKQTPKKVLMHASAFPSMGFVVQALAPYGFTLELIDSSLSPCDINTWEAALSEDIDICVITHVHSNTGEKSPVQAISTLCRHKGILSVVDIAQSVGIVPIDVKAWRVDAVLGSCVKWLCGGPGAGFIWVSQALLDELDMADIGWFSHSNPFEFDIHHFEPANNAMKLLGGTPSIAPYVIAQKSIDVLMHIGLDAVQTYNHAMKQQLLDTVNTLCLNEPDLSQQGGTLCLRFTQSDLSKLITQLDTHRIFYDRRGNTLRLSFHIYTSEQDIALLSACLLNAGLPFSC